jgi:hypothetical protein
MMLIEDFDNTDIEDFIVESSVMAWGKKGDKIVKKYRCLSGPRKNRLVNAPADCSKTIDPKKRIQLKKTMAKMGKRISRKARKTKRVSPVSKMIKRKNMQLSENLQKYGMSVEKAFANYANISDNEASDIIKNMPLSEYALFVTALDKNDDNELTQIVMKYVDEMPVEKQTESFFHSDDFNVILENMDFSTQSVVDFINGRSIKQINETKIFQNFKMQDMSVIKEIAPHEITEAYDIITEVSESVLNEFLDTWLLNEDADYRKKVDIGITKYVFENTINPQLKTQVARIANSSTSNVKAPAFTDPKTKAKTSIVSADAQSKTIATQDEKGNVQVHKIDPRNKSQISLESLQRLAGIKK